MKILIKSIDGSEVLYPEEPEKKNISAYFKYDEKHNCYYIMIVVIQELADFFEDIEKVENNMFEGFVFRRAEAFEIEKYGYYWVLEIYNNYRE